MGRKKRREYRWWWWWWWRRAEPVDDGESGSGARHCAAEVQVASVAVSDCVGPSQVCPRSFGCCCSSESQAQREFGGPGGRWWDAEAEVAGAIVAVVALVVAEAVWNEAAEAESGSDPVELAPCCSWAAIICVSCPPVEVGDLDAVLASSPELVEADFAGVGL